MATSAHGRPPYSAAPPPQHAALQRVVPQRLVPPERRSASPREVQAAAKRIAWLGALALLVSVTVGAFAGILLFVGGLTAFAAYAASHPGD